MWGVNPALGERDFHLLEEGTSGLDLAFKRFAKRGVAVEKKALAEPRKNSSGFRPPLFFRNPVSEVADHQEVTACFPDLPSDIFNEANILTVDR